MIHKRKDFEPIANALHALHSLVLSLGILCCFTPKAFAEGNFLFDISGPDREVTLASTKSDDTWSGITADLGAFALDIDYLPDGTLSIDPSWAALSEEIPIDLMEIPPRLRLSNFGGLFTAELALTSGVWHTIVAIAPDAGPTFAPSIPSGGLDLPASSVPYEVTSSRLPASRLVLHVNARKDVNLPDAGRPGAGQGSRPEAFRTMHAVADYARQSRAKVLEIVLEPGTYLWADFGDVAEEIILTPIGDVIIESSETQASQ